jgi:hypothetical protein
MAGNGALSYRVGLEHEVRLRCFKKRLKISGEHILQAVEFRREERK